VPAPLATAQDSLLPGHVTFQGTSALMLDCRPSPCPSPNRVEEAVGEASLGSAVNAQSARYLAFRPEQGSVHLGCIVGRTRPQAAALWSSGFLATRAPHRSGDPVPQTTK